MGEGNGAKNTLSVESKRKKKKESGKREGLIVARYRVVHVVRDLLQSNLLGEPVFY